MSRASQADALASVRIHPAAMSLPTEEPVIKENTGSVIGARRPWQDRRTLFLIARTPRRTASRRLAHGFRRLPKTM